MMIVKRWWLPAALTVTLGLAGWTAFAGPSQEQEERAQQEAFERRMGDALLRQGITLYQKGDYAGAIAAWERYIRAAPPNADTLSIREMIGEARAAEVAPSHPKGKARSPAVKSPAGRRKPLVMGRASLLVPAGHRTVVSGCIPGSAKRGQA